jgi:hypothetical protein
VFEEPRSSASTTTWARRRSRTCWRSASPTACSSRCGTATTSTRADHRGRGHRHRQPRRLLRPVRRAARPDPEPHAPAALPRGDGAAGELHRRRGAQREGQGAAGDPEPTPEDISEMAVRAQYSRGHSGGEDVPGYLEEEGVPDRLNDRDLRGAAPGSRQLALGRRPLLPAHRQAPGAQDHRDRRHPEARPPPRLQPGWLAGRAAQPAGADAAAQRGRVAAAGRQDPRHAHEHPPGEHGVPVRHLVPVTVAGGLRAADHRRHARRRRRCSRATTRSRRNGASATRSCGAWAKTPGPAAAVRSGLAGTERGRTTCCSTATTGARSDAGRQRRRVERAGDDARCDRSGAARPAAERHSENGGFCPRACST